MTTRQWSAQQEAIFDHFHHGGPVNLVVRARAGTGKTTTIIEAIRRANETHDILLCAFNKRIAEEMNRKLQHGGAVARTLHAVGFDFVRRNWSKVRVDDDRKFRLARRAWAEDARRKGDRRPMHTLEDLAPDPVIGAIVKLAALGKNAAPHASVSDLADLAIGYAIQPENGWADEVSTDDLATLAHTAMRMATERDGTLDFDDMIFLPVFHRWARPSYNLIVVDEAQDMNAAQLELALACARGRIVVVGDDRQAIYGFRGADSNALTRLREELHAIELPLTITYRCPKNVVAVAQAIVPDYTAAPSAPDGTVAAATETQMMRQATPGDFILSRTNGPLARIALALLRDGKRARIEGRDIAKTLTSLVRRMKAETIPDLMTALDRWGQREADKLRGRKGNPAAMQARLDYVADMVATVDALADGLADVAELNARIEELFSETHGPAIVCSTVHKAKGLEADRVFVLAETLYCGGHRITEEERNIHYVAVTRAKDTLVMVEGR